VALCIDRSLERVRQSEPASERIARAVAQQPPARRVVITVKLKGELDANRLRLGVHERSMARARSVHITDTPLSFPWRDRGGASRKGE
jgi:hypothetical protein